MTDNKTFRPGGIRVVAYGCGVAIIAMTVAIGVALPDYVTFRPAELFTLSVILLVTLGILHGFGRSYVRETDEALEILNGYKRRVVPWNDIEGFSMKSGAPWPTLITKGDERIILFAIQGSDGDDAKRAVQHLLRHLP